MKAPAIGVAVLLVAALAGSARAAHPTLIQPYDVQPLANGHFLVSDLPAGAVYDLDPVRKTGTLVASIPQARELQLLPGGRVLVSSGAQVLALSPRTGKTSVYARFKNYLLGIA